MANVTLFTLELVRSMRPLADKALIVFIFIGECICAPHVTGPDDNPCTECEENTFGYDPITGCQECMCDTDGTINANMSCALDSGNC